MFEFCILSDVILPVLCRVPVFITHKSFFSFDLQNILYFIGFGKNSDMNQYLTLSFQDK